MKKIITLLLLGFSIFLISCNEEDGFQQDTYVEGAYTMEKHGDEIANMVCHKMQACEEPEFDEEYEDIKDCISKRRNQLTNPVCKKFIPKDAYDCITCINDLSCYDHFEKPADEDEVDCPTCETGCLD